MIFTLKNYKDLGRCSYGTLREEFDTEKDTIYLNDYKIEVKKVEDLFPFLWQSPGISGHDGDTSFAIFHDHTTHWHRDFDESIERENDRIAKLENNIKKSNDPKKTEKWNLQLKYSISHRDAISRICIMNDEAMEEQKKQLIAENCRD